jgi:hypothetical protein
MIIKNKYFWIKLALLIFLIIVPFSLNVGKDGLETKYLEVSSLSFYQTETCEISFFDFWNHNIGNKNIIIKADYFSSIDCFGKVNGVDYLGESFNVYIGTNLNINLVLQSLFWIILISFIKIPTKDNLNVNILKSTPLVNILFVAGLFTSQIFTESKFYFLYNKNMDSNLGVGNFFVLSIFLGFLIILKISDDVITPRASLLLNYLPFIFLVIGTYSSSNMNFYIAYFCLLGTRNINLNVLRHKFTLIYIVSSIVWFFNQSSINNYFDVDKIRGFVNSENNPGSLMFWIIVFYLFLNGLIYIFNKFDHLINFEILQNNFLVAGSLTVIFGFLGTLNSNLNFLNFYVFGQNKNGMNTFQSVAGNTWRGFSSSAEAIGEFYGVAILISLYFIFKLKKVSPFQVILIGINFYGLLKTNDAAVLISIIIISSIYLTLQLTTSSKNTTKVLLGLGVFIFLILSILYSVFNPGISRDYDFLSENLLIESLKNSIYFESENLYVENLIKNSNYKDITYLDDYDERLSNSTKALLENYISDKNIKFLPSFSSTISIGSSLINRTDKWGLFIARYNPDILELTFGSGPMQFNNFYNSHQIKFTDGLILPHSSLLNTLLFFGMTGVAFGLFWILKILFTTNSDLKYLLLFYILNLLKSDSILYVSSFILFIFIINYCRKSSYGVIT